MNKLFTKVATLSIGLAMAIGVGVAVGSKSSKSASETKAAGEILAYTFDCASASSSGSQSLYGVSNTTAMANTGIKKFLEVAAGSEIIKSVASSPTRVYWAKGTGGDSALLSNVLKVGAASNAGSFSFTLIDDAPSIVKVVITAQGWKNTSKLKVNTATQQTLTQNTTSTDYTFDLSTASKTISIDVSTSAVLITSIKLYKSGTVSSYTVSYNANGLSGNAMPDSTGSSITLSNNAYTLPNGATFRCWNTEADGSGDDYNEGAVVSANLTLYAKWGYLITYKANGSGESDVTEYTVKNTSYSVKKNMFEYNGYVFTKWNTLADGSGANYLEDAAITTPSSTLTLFAQWETDPCNVDFLDKTFTGVTGTSYSSWTGTGNASSTPYSGHSAASNDSIQLKSDGSVSGIVSTASHGTLARVKVVWESHTAEGRTLDIYGKNEEYKAVSELYGEDAGTKLGSIVCGTSTSLTVSGNYAYIGIRSNNGAIYLSSIKIAWLPITNFSVAYNLNGGTSGTVPSTVTNQSENDLKSFTVASVPNDFYKFGYTCDGWSSSSSGSKEYNSNTAYDLSGKVSGSTVTLYAHWAVRTVTGLTAGSTSPTTKTYEVGQVFNPAGLTIHAIFDSTYEDSTDITSQVVWAALEKGSTATGTYTFNNVAVNITITGLTITGPDVVISPDTVPSNVTTDSNADTRTGYIGSVNYEYFAFQKYNNSGTMVLEFKSSEDGYIANLDSYGKYISYLTVELTSASDFSNFTMYEGSSSKPLTTTVAGTGTGTTKTYTFQNESEYFTFKKTSGSSWYKILSIKVYLGAAVPEKIVNTVSINDPGTIYDGGSKQLVASVTYTNSATVDSNVTWEKVSGTSDITSTGMFTASGTTATVVRATSVLKNAQNQNVSAEFTITPAEKMIKTGHKYFVVSSDNEIFLAKNLDGTYVSSGSSKEKFLSTATLTQNGKYVVAISGASSSLEDYAWTLNETETDKYEFKNAGDKYFNIWSSGSFYVDASTENFEFTELNNSGYYSIKSLKTNTYLNISDGTFVTSSSTASTGYKFLEYAEFGTLDHIEVNEELSKTEYYLNDTFNTSDVVVVGYDENGIPQAIASGYTCSGYSMSIAGVQTVTVTYSEKSDTYSINVIKWRSVTEYSNVVANYNFGNSTGVTVDGINAGYVSGTSTLSAITAFSGDTVYSETPS